MSRRRLSFTERRRRALALKSAQLDRLETRNTITEPISVTGLSLSAFRGLAQLGIMQADGGNSDLLALAQLSEQAKQLATPAHRSGPAVHNGTSLAIGKLAAHSKRAAGVGAAQLDTVRSKGANRKTPIDWAVAEPIDDVHTGRDTRHQHNVAAGEPGRGWRGPGATRRLGQRRAGGYDSARERHRRSCDGPAAGRPSCDHSRLSRESPRAGFGSGRRHAGNPGAGCHPQRGRPEPRRRSRRGFSGIHRRGRCSRRQPRHQVRRPSPKMLHHYHPAPSAMAPASP